MFEDHEDEDLYFDDDNGWPYEDEDEDDQFFDGNEIDVEEFFEIFIDSENEDNGEE